MRILLDECVNPRVRAAFQGHEVSTVLEQALGQVELIFDVLMERYEPIFADLREAAEKLSAGQIVHVTNPLQ